MALKPIIAYSVQLFVLVKGRVALGNLINCKAPEEACRVAEDRVGRGRAIGAAAFTRTVVDADYDDGGEPITLAIFGKAPLGLADQLPFEPRALPMRSLSVRFHSSSTLRRPRP